MSLFHDYTRDIAHDYSERRTPNGADLYLGLVYSLTGKTADKIHLLDAGCGTGNFSEYLLQRGLARVTMFDASENMLAESHRKLVNFINDGKATLERYELPKMPYPNDRFDVVMMNQVLHHLTSEVDPDHSKVYDAIIEAYRVLKPNGVLLVNSSTPRHQSDGYWYQGLYPESTRKSCQRLIDEKTLMGFLQRAGFTNEGLIVKPLELMVNEDVYLQADGPLHKSWQSLDSTVSSASDEERHRAIETTTRLLAEGKMNEYMMENDKARLTAGQFGIFYGNKFK